jgi:hypothetical protein
MKQHIISAKKSLQIGIKASSIEGEKNDNN